MIDSKDIIKTGVKTDWIELGLEYALKSWTYTYNRMGSGNPYSRIEKIILGLMAENAFIDYLKKNNIEYDELGKTMWYQKDLYDVGIGKYRTDVKSNHINFGALRGLKKINEIDLKSIEENDFSWFLDCTALVPLDQISKKTERKEKIYIFPFSEGKTKAKSSESKGAIVHAFWDYDWLKKSDYKDSPQLGRLIFEFNNDNANTEEFKIIIYGTTEPKKFVRETVSIRPGKKTLTSNSFYQVFSLRLLLPDIPFGFGNLKIITATRLIETVCGSFGFKNHREDEELILDYNNWHEVYCYNPNVYLTGYINERDFRVKGKKYPRFSKNIKQYPETKVDNLGIDVKKLSPLSELEDI